MAEKKMCKAGDLVYVPVGHDNLRSEYIGPFSNIGRIGVLSAPYREGEYGYITAYIQRDNNTYQVLNIACEGWKLVCEKIQTSKRRTPVVNTGDIVHALGQDGYDITDDDLVVVGLPMPCNPYLRVHKVGTTVDQWLTSWRRHAVGTPQKSVDSSPDATELRELTKKIADKYVRLGHITSEMASQMLRDVGINGNPDENRAYATISLTVPVPRKHNGEIATDHDALSEVIRILRAEIEHGKECATFAWSFSVAEPAAPTKAKVARVKKDDASLDVTAEPPVDLTVTA